MVTALDSARNYHVHGGDWVAENAKLVISQSL